jgi:pimeloyl-ACP methyl ester carboxylesterase
MWRAVLDRAKKSWRVSLGAGILGALVLAFRYAVRPIARPKLPETISPAIFATRLLPTSRGQIVYHESGQGEPLLFVHGVYVGASSYEWSKVYPFFAGTHRTMAMDLLGFGESERPNQPLSAADQVDVLAQFLQAKGDKEPATLVASGLAGGFAAMLAAQHPDLVQRLILVMPIGELAGIPRRYRIISKVPLFKRALYRRHISGQAQVKKWLERYGFTQAEAVTAEDVNVISYFAQQWGAEYAVFRWLSGRFDLDLERRLSEIPHPVTLIWGDKVAYPPLEQAYRLQPVARRCSLAVMEHTGLLAALESPQAMVDVLGRELDRTIRVFKAG